MKEESDVGILDKFIARLDDPEFLKTVTEEDALKAIRVKAKILKDKGKAEVMAEDIKRLDELIEIHNDKPAVQKALRTTPTPA